VKADEGVTNNERQNIRADRKEKKFSDGGLKNMTINSILRLDMETLLP
jgi:hypothetical protein